MTSQVTQRPRARLDLLEQFVYFGEHSGIELAERYLTAVEQTCGSLAKNPEMGALYDSGVARLHGSRRFPVAGFERHLIFYIPQPNGIEVVRILHGARDIDNLLVEEES